MATTHPDKHARIHVARHADAGVRGHDPDDHLRPLSPGGHARAEVLAELLELTSASRTVSSAYVRCVQTVEPLAAQQRRSVELSDSLACPGRATDRADRQRPELIERERAIPGVFEQVLDPRQLCSLSGSGDSFHVFVRWNVIPSAIRI